eukprot:jgi/Mesvir1/7049/Mv09165-RA.1
MYSPRGTPTGPPGRGAGRVPVTRYANINIAPTVHLRKGSDRRQLFTPDQLAKGTRGYVHEGLFCPNPYFESCRFVQLIARVEEMTPQMNLASILVAVFLLNTIARGSCEDIPYPTSLLFAGIQTYLVGGANDAWARHPDPNFFQNWANTVRPQVGDRLEFQWGRRSPSRGPSAQTTESDTSAVSQQPSGIGHNIWLLPSVEAMASCDFTQPGSTLLVPASPHTTRRIDLNTPGVQYFASSSDSDCQYGMRFAIMVAPRATVACTNTHQSARQACLDDAQARFNLAIGTCYNAAQRESCSLSAFTDLQGATAACDQQLAAGADVCRQLGEAAYLPRGISPFSFVRNPVGNDYFPLTPANYTYRGYSALYGVGILTNVTVLEGTVTIRNQSCVAVRVTSRVDNSSRTVLDDTLHWYAQDVQGGNVWIFGYAADASCKRDILAAAPGYFWMAGEDGAKAGVVMFGDPVRYVGLPYRQGLQVGRFESIASVNRRVDVLPPLPAGVALARNITGPFLLVRETHLLPVPKTRSVYYAKNFGTVLFVEGNGSWSLMVSYARGAS